MTTRKFNYKPVTPGFPWSATVRVKSETIFFQPGDYKAELRSNVNSDVIATLTTQNGGLTIVDGESISIKISGINTNDIHSEYVLMDVVKTDGAEPTHTGLRLSIPVEKSVTSRDMP